MKIGDYLSELLSFNGILDAKRYTALLTPITFFFGALNFIGVLAGITAGWKIGGWVVLAAVAGGILSPIPISMRRARDIGWAAIFAPILSTTALISIAAFMSLLLPVSLGIWSALEQSGINLLIGGVIFAACIGLWAWWWVSLLDRPTKGAVAPVATDSPASTTKRRRPPLWFIIAWAGFFGVILAGNYFLAARYYLAGQGDKPALLGLVVVSLIVGIILWYWFSGDRSARPKSPSLANKE